MKILQCASTGPITTALLALLILILARCDSQSLTSESASALNITLQQSQLLVAANLALTVSDTVTVAADASVYRKPDTNSELLGVAPTGSKGVIERESRNEMWLVSFFDGSTLRGWVREIDLEADTSGSPPPPPPPPPTPEEITLGGASCSMGRDFFESYTFWKANNPDSAQYPHWPKETENGEKITKSWTGGGLQNWGTPGAGGYNIKWTSLDNGVAYLEPTVLLFMVCEADANGNDAIDEEEIEMAGHVSEEMLSRVPNAALWITGEPRHEPGSACDNPAPELAHALADSAAARGYFQRADIEIVLTPEMVKPSGCHVDADGIDYEGPIMAAWLASLDN